MSKSSERGVLKSIIFILLTIILVQYYFLKQRQLTFVFNSFHSKNHSYSNDIFKQIALKYGTDKVTTHHYEYVYGQLVAPIRFVEIHFLEIGLGCSMSYGPGKSLLVWKEFMPNANISILEFDEECARPFKSQVTHLFVGDQSDLNVLEMIGKTTNEMFDLIVDDGGHTRKQQINSLIGLWPFIRKNGGIYIIEDIFTSFIPSYNDNTKSSLDVIFELIVILNDPTIVGYKPPHLMPKVNISKQAMRISKELASINCFERACALIKK